MEHPPTMESGTTTTPANPPSRVPRHCFICLADDTDDATPQEWVTPCPCTLEGHQECMLSWVASRENDRRPLECPVCKARIKVSAPWSPVAELNDAWNAAVLGAAPWVLAGTTVAGVYAANFAHGMHSLATFAGPDAARAALYTSWPARGFWDVRWSTVAAVAHLTPVMVLLRLAPGWGIRSFPTLGATAIGIYKVIHPGFSLRKWPPSPWAALFFAICMRSAYFRLWKAYLGGPERRIDRMLDNLPPDPEPDAQRARAEVNNADQRNNRGVGLVGWILERLIQGLVVEVDDRAREGRRQRRLERRRARQARGVLAAAAAQPQQGEGEGDEGENGHGPRPVRGAQAALPDLQALMNRLDALNVRMDEQFRAHVQELGRLRGPGANVGAAEPARAVQDAAGPAGGDNRDTDAEAADQRDGAAAAANQDANADAHDQQNDEDDNDDENVVAEIAFEIAEVGVEDDDGGGEIVVNLPPIAVEIQAAVGDGDDDDDDDNNDDNDNNNENGHDAAAAPPAPRGVNAGSALDRLITELTISFLFPTICFSLGEMLRLTVLPRSWTEPSASVAAGLPWAGRRPGDGLLSKRWGRSLLGGCVFVVVRDAVRVYAKYSRLRDRALKRVESVDRSRARAQWRG